MDTNKPPTSDDLTAEAERINNSGLPSPWMAKAARDTIHNATEAKRAYRKPLIRRGYGSGVAAVLFGSILSRVCTGDGAATAPVFTHLRDRDADQWRHLRYGFHSDVASILFFVPVV